MKITCDISEVGLEDDYGREVDGIIAECSRCGHEVECFGDSDSSVRRALYLMRQECPQGKSNFYVAGK